MTKKEIAKVEDKKTELTVAAAPLMQGETIDASDVLLPSLYLMQSNSTWVKEEKARNGAMVKSTGVTTVADRKESLVIVPLAFNKSFRIVEKKGNKWVRNEPFNPALADQWDFSEDGRALKRVACINVYAYLMKELLAQEAARLEAEKSGEMMDPGSIALPVLISFRSKGYKAGKECITHFALAQKVRSEPYMGKLEVFATEETNESGTFYVFNAKPVRGGDKLTPAMVKDCADWRKLMVANQVKVDDSEEAESTVETSEQY